MKFSTRLVRIVSAFRFAVALPSLATAQASPSLTVSTRALTFAPTAVGAISAGQTVTVTNTGPGSVEFVGSDSGDFVISDNCEGYLTAGQSCTGTVAFRPTAIGSRSTTFNIFVAGAPAPVPVHLSGTGTNGVVPQPLRLTTDALTFGPVALGGLSFAHPVTVTNPNNFPVTLIDSSLAGANARDYRIATNTCSVELPAQATCSFTVLFTPTAFGERNASIVLLTTADTAFQTISLRGSGELLSIGRLVANLDIDQLVYHVQVIGNGFSQGCTLESGSTPLPTTFANSILSTTVKLTPAMAGRFPITEVCAGVNGESLVSNKIELFLDPPGLKSIGQLANDIAWDRVHGVIYASVPGSAAHNSNSIVVIDPAEGTIKSSIYTGSDPDALAVSDDGHFLYVCLDGASGVQRFLLPELTPDIFVPLGANRYPGSTVALALEIAPGSPHTWAVSTGNRAVTTPAALGKVTVYDDGIARPMDTGTYVSGTGYLSIGSIVWGKDASVLYGADNEESPSALYILPVGESGIDLSSSTTYKGVLDPFFDRIHFDRGTNLIYQDTGSGQQSAKSIDPSNGYQGGSYGGFGVLVPDGVTGKVFFAPYSNIPFLDQYDRNFFSNSMEGFSQIGTLPIPGLQGDPGRIIRFGENGLAVNTFVRTYEGTKQVVSGGDIYFYEGPFVH